MQHQRSKPRPDLPEYRTYVDTGCDLAEHCLSCPFSQCRYDAQRAHHPRVAERQRAVIDAYQDGTPAARVAMRLGVHERSVYRMLARPRAG